MKIAKDIVDEVRFINSDSRDNRSDDPATIDARNKEYNELEEFISAKLEPMKEAFANIVKHQDIVMGNMPPEMSVTRRIAVEAFALFNDE